MNYRFKINDPNKEFCVGLFCHKVLKFTREDEDSEFNEEPVEGTRLVIGILIASVEIIL